jgi:hypothetical protein
MGYIGIKIMESNLLNGIKRMNSAKAKKSKSKHLFTKFKYLIKNWNLFYK